MGYSLGCQSTFVAFLIAAVVAAPPSSAQNIQLPYNIQVLRNDAQAGLICTGPLGPGPCARIIQWLAERIPTQVPQETEQSLFDNPGQMLGGPNSVINNPGQIFNGGESPDANPSLVEQKPWGFCPPPCKVE